MKVLKLHRKQHLKTVKLVKKGRTLSIVDISAQVEKARSHFCASRDDFAARAAKAKKSFPKRSHPVMLG